MTRQNESPPMNRSEIGVRFIGCNTKKCFLLGSALAKAQNSHLAMAGFVGECRAHREAKQKLPVN